MNRMNESQRTELARMIEEIASAEIGQLQLDAALDAIAETLLPETTNRYFEVHITYTEDEDPENTWESFVEMCNEFGWKASRFDHDDVDGIAGKWFCSYRHTSHDEALRQLRGMVHGLSCNGTVERYKIEETLLDSKHGDQL